MSNNGAIFTKWVKGQNFITPDFIRYGREGEYVYELTSGTGFKCPKLYGVTVVTKDGGEQDELSKGGFESLEEAEKYISTLKGL